MQITELNGDEWELLNKAKIKYSSETGKKVSYAKVISFLLNKYLEGEKNGRCNSKKSRC